MTEDTGLTQQQLQRLADAFGFRSLEPPTVESLLAFAERQEASFADARGFFRAIIQIAYTMDWFCGTELGDRELGRHIFQDTMSRFIRLATLEGSELFVPPDYDAAYVPPQHRYWRP